jgi:RNA polymerase sigma-70 factor, ECF subfamily
MTTTGPSGDRDAALLGRAAAGSEVAFEMLVVPLADSAYRLALTLLRDHGEAEDAVQEATLKAWRKIHQVRPGMPFRPWFLAITANQCRSMRRRRWRDLLSFGSVERPEAPADDRVVRDADLRRALARLGDEDRLAVYVFFYLDLPLEEAAAVLGLSVPAARSRIYRAARRLRPSLELDEVVS